VLKDADSATIPIREVLSQTEWERRSADSVARADSARPDSLRRADTARVTAERPPAGRASAPPRPNAAIPATVIYILLERPLVPASSYRLRAVGLRSISGATRTSERQFATPRPRTRPDTTSSRDTAGRSIPRSR